MKEYDKNKESLLLNYWGINYLHRWAIPQKLPVDGFNSVKNLSKTSMKIVMKDVF